MSLPYEVYANLDIVDGRVKILKTNWGDTASRMAGRKYVSPIDEMALCMMHTHPRGSNAWFSAPDLVNLARSVRYPSYVGAWYILISRYGYTIAKASSKMIKTSIDFPSTMI